MEGFQTLDSTCALHQPTNSVRVFQTESGVWDLEVNMDQSVALLRGAVSATLHHIMGIPFQGHYWEDDTEVTLSRGDTIDDVNHNNIVTLQYKSMG